MTYRDKIKEEMPAMIGQYINRCGIPKNLWEWKCSSDSSSVVQGEWRYLDRAGTGDNIDVCIEVEFTGGRSHQTRTWIWITFFKEGKFRQIEEVTSDNVKEAVRIFKERETLLPKPKKQRRKKQA